MKRFVVGRVVALVMAASSTSYAQDTKPGQPHGYMIVNYDINDQAGFQKYMDAAGTLVGKYNGRVIVFNLRATAVEGKPHSVIGIAEFPNLAEAQRFYNSPEYIAARQFRIAATEGSVIITEGLPQQ